jgi:1-deoxy-D-xylulose-5-phosphate reductoisomerase
VNAANEIAVEAFLDRRLPFPGIAAVIEQTLAVADPAAPASIDDVIAQDAAARRHAAQSVARHAAARSVA